MRVASRRCQVIVLGALAAVGLGLAAPAHAALVTLFTTQTDFSAYTADAGYTAAPSGAYDADGSNVNGLGTAGGGTGTPGSLELTGFSGTYGEAAYNYNESGNQAFLNVFDPGALVGSNLATYSGVLQMTYTLPDDNGGNYFQLGILINATNQYTQVFGTDSSLGTVDGLTTVLATIPYTVTATPSGGGFYLGFNILYNSNYAPTLPYYVDNIQAVVPEPASIGLLGAASLLTMRRRRRT